MKLSIIVPVYNVEVYLRKCVDSLLAQDYSDYEIILVDDGSTDNCPAICDEYASKYPISNIQYPIIYVLHQPNAGLSAARNSGIKIANGEYICFVDSDDYWQHNVLGDLMAHVNNDNLDVLRFDYQNVRINNISFKDFECERVYEVFEPNKQPHQVDQRTEIVSGVHYLNERMGYACYAWQFIIRKDIVNLFTPGIHYEDVEWLPRMMMKAKRVNSTTKIVYNYLWREGSITLTQGNTEKIRKNIEDRLLIIDIYRQYIEQSPKCKWLKNIQSGLVAGTLMSIAQSFYSERKEYINQLYQFNVFPLKIDNQGRTYTRRARIINILGPQIYCFLMHMRSKM